MPNDALIQVRIDAKTKSRAAKLFKRFGLSTSDGVRLLINQALREKDLPRLPNASSIEAIEDARTGKGERVTMDELRKMWNDA